jgi:hypothetical protein
MLANVGSVDRFLRLIAGLALIIIPFVAGGGVFDGMAMQVGAVIVGAVLVVTALAGRCPLYSLFGIRTSR